MEKLKNNESLGNLLNVIVKYFHEIPLSKNYQCKSYTISSCAYEESIIVTDSLKKYSIEMIIEYDIITHIVIIENKILRSRRHSIEGIKSINENFNSLEDKIREIAIRIAKLMKILMKT